MCRGCGWEEEGESERGRVSGRRKSGERERGKTASMSGCHRPTLSPYSPLVYTPAVGERYYTNFQMGKC